MRVRRGIMRLGRIGFPTRLLLVLVGLRSGGCETSSDQLDTWSEQMKQFEKRAVLTMSALVVMNIAHPSHAEVINTLPGGTQLSFVGGVENKRLDDGRFMRDYVDFTFAAAPAPVSTNHFVATSLATANFGSHQCQMF